LGVRPTDIGLSGASAGGGLAAGLALRLRDEGYPMPRFLHLDVPMLDDRQCTPSSHHDGLLVWTRESNEFGWRAYLGELYGTDQVPAWAAPARCTDLRGLPPTFVSAGGADGFRDEDIAFALALGQAGVLTDLIVVAGAPHGVAMFSDTDVAGRMTQASTEWLDRQLASLTA
jgi:acetyl esterase/lipase